MRKLFFDFRLPPTPTPGPRSNSLILWGSEKAKSGVIGLCSAKVTSSSRGGRQERWRVPVSNPFLQPIQLVSQPQKYNPVSVGKKAIGPGGRLLRKRGGGMGPTCGSESWAN